MADEPAPADNSGETARRPDGMPVGRPFRAGGLSPNPGGRPRGIARRIRETFGDEAEALLGYAATVMSGYARLIDPETNQITYEKVSVADRTNMMKVLLERGWGKPREYPPIEDDAELGYEDVNKVLADGFEKAMDELAQRRHEKRAAEAAEAADG